MIKNSVFFLCFFFCSYIIQAQLSKKHYLPPLTSAEFGNANPENQYFYISTPSTQNITYTITPIGQPATSIVSGIVSNTTPVELFIGTGNGQLFVDANSTSVVTTDKGYIVEADDVIYVSIRMQAGNSAQAGALVSKGISALGNTFRVGTYTNQNPQSNYLNFVSIMATENNTSVTFDDLPAGIAIKNYSGPTPINIILNEGESYTVATNSSENTTNTDGLIGTLIQADKPIVTSCGSTNGSFHNGGGRDYGIDQIVGLDKVGTEYIFVRGSGNDGWENILLVAHQNNTTISINGNPSVATINAGEYYLIEGNNYSSNENMYVETSNAVFAYQGIGGANSEANQGLFFVPPLSCENRGTVNNIPMIESIGAVDYTGGVTIITNIGASVTINNLPIESFTTSGPNTVDGNPNYVTYKVSGLAGNITIESTEELYCAYFNYNGAATSGSFYSGFPSAPEINFNVIIQNLGHCIPNITLEGTNTTLFDSYEWFFNDGTGYSSTGNNSTSITPSLPGTYKLVGTIDCSGLSFDSSEIPISICPDDYDNDFIIDNLDIDIDNDGITNCNESKGDAILNLTNTTLPVVLFQDGSNNTTIATGTTTQTNSNSTTNTFTGFTDGSFTSIANPATESSNRYVINFTSPINLEFTPNTTTSVATNGEYFILKIGPNNKNITLIDTDNTLLIDTNFDGVFETGITSFSASEIHFKHNPSSLGTTPFQFVANQIQTIDFTHQLNNLTETATFNGLFRLTCLDEDTDNDGLVNSFDLDSDNDGIPDSIEASGSLIFLTNLDTNLDGLDNAFTLGTTLLDTDNDGVYDYKDLDSDNDGIYDLEEADSNALDVDLNGVADNAIINSGNNGWLDILETAPDTGLIAYTVADSDSNLVFNYTSLDSDSDACYDTVEAGFTDLSNDGLLGGTPLQTDSNGLVTNTTDGYSNPDENYIISAPILINTPFGDVDFCETETAIISLDSNADIFQWEQSTDGLTWVDITDNTIYNGVNTNTLEISSLTLTFNNYQYRVFLEKNGNSCSLITNSITLAVHPKPILLASVTLKQCDDDTDGITNFNLNEANSLISVDAANETFTFYTSETAAQTGGTTDLIANPTTFSASNGVTVWTRVETVFGCYRTAQINLVVSTTQIPSSFTRTFTQCDDFLDIDGNDTLNNDDTDGVSAFDFSAVTADVIALFPVGQQLTVQYYRNEADALAELNVITDPSNYRNSGYPTSQQIYVRVDSDLDNACIGFGPYITLNVTSVPLENSVPNLFSCDDFESSSYTDGVSTDFMLSDQTATILGGQDPAVIAVTYHASAAEANTGTNPLASPYTNTIPNLQTIYVRLTNTLAGCFTDHITFDLVVQPLPIAHPVADLEICDDDSDGSARNGFSQSLNLETQSATILGAQDPSLFSLTYHESLANAQAGILPLSSPFSNSVPFLQTIYVRVVNNNTLCSNGISNFNIIVNQEPLANPNNTVSNLSYCDDDNAGLGDDTDGIYENIDLDSQIPDILGSSQATADFFVTFHLLQSEATDGSNPLASPYTNAAGSSTTTIFVRVENSATGCINDQFSFDVIINPLPDFQVTSPQIVCLNNPPLTLEVENPNAVYSYQWTNENGIILSNNSYQNVIAGGLYTVTATFTNGTGCTRTRSIQVNESSIATITYNDITIVDDSENNSITINPTNLGIGDYEYSLLDSNGNTAVDFQDEPLFEHLEGDIYTILVQDKNGCGIASLDVSVIEFPKFFTPNNDGIKDAWMVLGVNIDFYPESSMYIFNRYGKVISEIKMGTNGWNGLFNGKLQPSNDYWFHVILVDRNGNMRDRTGHFSLLRY